jgi:hypothetical protein
MEIVLVFPWEAKGAVFVKGKYDRLAGICLRDVELFQLVIPLARLDVDIEADGDPF